MLANNFLGNSEALLSVRTSHQERAGLIFAAKSEASCERQPRVGSVAAVEGLESGFSATLNCVQ
jgi:hypothetical protein